MGRVHIAACVLAVALTAGCGGGDNAVLDSPDGGSGASSNGGSGSGGNAGGSNGGAAGAAGSPVSCADGSGNCPDLTCAPGYTCTADPANDVVWAMKDDGNVNGPSCQKVCEAALPGNCAYYACDQGRQVKYTDMPGFANIAQGLGFKCRAGGCWSSVSPTAGQILVSKDMDSAGTRSCYFPAESMMECTNDPGNANCYGERYASVCPCVVKPLDQACTWDCPPHNTTRAVWKTTGDSCLDRINYWRKRACEEGWVECPPAGLPPMVECTACHECDNSEAAWDKTHGAHNSFKRCGEFVQGEGGGATCADVIDAFVSERKPDANGVMRCQGHCGPIVKPGCQTFSWGKDKDSNFYTLNWGNCNSDKCQTYCTDHPGDCYTVPTSPSLTCDDPSVGAEANPKIAACN